MRLAILGFGLIGGSVALSLAARERGKWQVTAWSPTLSGPRRALSRGVVAAVAPDPETAVASSDLVLLAATPVGNLALVERVGRVLAGTDTTVSDVSSTQSEIARRAAAVEGLHFVGGHPMSGRERRGYGAATPDLFEGRTWAVVPSPASRPVDVERVRRLAKACGSRPLELDAETHDRAVGGVSHLPLLTSVALGEAVVASDAWPVARQLAAQGWRDTTRLARGDPQLGGGIIATNAGHLADWLRSYRAVLDGWQRTLDSLVDGAPAGRRSEPVEERLREVAAALEGDSRT